MNGGRGKQAKSRSTDTDLGKIQKVNKVGLPERYLAQLMFLSLNLFLCLHFCIISECLFMVVAGSA